MTLDAAALTDDVSAPAPALAEGEMPLALRDCVARAVRRFLSDLDEQTPEDLYDMVLREVERPLIAEVMGHFAGNQSRAAAALGINRATLRKKLKALNLG